MALHRHTMGIRGGALVVATPPPPHCLPKLSGQSRPGCEPQTPMPDRRQTSGVRLSDSLLRRGIFRPGLHWKPHQDIETPKRNHQTHQSVRSSDSEWRDTEDTEAPGPNNVRPMTGVIYNQTHKVARSSGALSRVTRLTSTGTG